MDGESGFCRFPGLLFELLGVKVIIITFLTQQIVVAALFDDFSVTHDQEDVYKRQVPVRWCRLKKRRKDGRSAPRRERLKREL